MKCSNDEMLTCSNAETVLSQLHHCTITTGSCPSLLTSQAIFLMSLASSSFVHPSEVPLKNDGGGRFHPDGECAFSVVVVVVAVVVVVVVVLLLAAVLTL